MSVTRTCRRRFWLCAITLGLAIVILAWTCGGAALAAAGAWLDIGQAPAQTDFVLVLPGGPDTRPYVAAALVKAGFAREAILLKCRPSADDLVSGFPQGHEVEEKVLLARNVPAEKIHIVDSNTVSTFSDAESLQVFLADHQDATTTIVTNDFHTRRARFSFRRVFGRDARRLYFVSAPTDRYSATNWWRHKRGLKAYGSEFLKLTYYFLRYSSGWMWASGVSLVVISGMILYRSHRQRPTAQAA
ncbi:MAG TPA: YdcF family protein [Pirellulales bacterium]|nr:YdcF family protein [Pirellulales bacterium]